MVQARPGGWSLLGAVCAGQLAVPLEGACGLTPLCGEGEAQALFQGLVFRGGPILALEPPSGGSAHYLL